MQSVYRVSGGAGLALTTGALLHAERPPHSAAVGRRVRRVPDLHDARPGGSGSTRPRISSSPTAAARSTAAAASNPTSASTVRSRASTRRGSAARSSAASSSPATPSGSTRTATRVPAPRRPNGSSRGQGLRRGRRDADRLQEVRGGERVKMDEAAWTQDTGLHPRHGPLRDRLGGLRDGRGPPPPLEVDPQAQHALGALPQSRAAPDAGQKSRTTRAGGR